MRLSFVDGQPGSWRVASASLEGSCEGVTFAGDRRWWGKRWTLAGRSAFPVPERIILFISSRGMDHGYWRDLSVGHAAFDVDHFVFCDTPALLPLIVGAETRRAVDAASELDLYVRGGITRTTGVSDESDPNAIARHVAIHQALEVDHRAMLARWDAALSAVHGRATAHAWPPAGTIMSRGGTLLVGLSWALPPESRDAYEWNEGVHSLRTEIVGQVDRERSRWGLWEVGAGTASTHEIGGRCFAVTGKPTLSLPQLGAFVEAGAVVSIACGPRIVVSTRGIAGPKQLDGCVKLVEHVMQATAGSTSPYR